MNQDYPVNIEKNEMSPAETTQLPSANGTRSKEMITNGALLLGAIVIALFIGEFTLYVLQYPAHYTIVRVVPDMVPWWICDNEKGNYYSPGKSKGPWPVNGHGHLGLTDFTPEHAHGEFRVLFLGDSFTWGSTASRYDRSFARLFEHALPEEQTNVIWNTAIGGTGQKQQLISLETYFPLLQPHLVVLGFYINDFNDNMLPLAVHYVFPECMFVFRYEKQADGSFVTLSPEQAYRRAVRAANSIPEYIGASRLISLFRDARKQLGAYFWETPAPPQEFHDKCCPGCMTVDSAPEVRPITTELLRQIQHYVMAHGARFLLLLIPSPCDVETPSNTYLAAKDICQELGIEYVEVRSLLSEEDYMPLPDIHWNDSGHRIAAEALTAHVNAMFGFE